MKIVTNQQYAEYKRYQKTKRNIAVIEMYRSGASYKEISARFGGMPIQTINSIRIAMNEPIRPKEMADNNRRVAVRKYYSEMANGKKEDARIRATTLNDIDAKLALICQKLGIEV